MNNIKIIFFDIDGTMVDMATKSMSDKTEQALLALQEKGIKIGIATGRPLINVPKFPNIDFDVYLTFNGCYSFAKRKLNGKLHDLEPIDVVFNNPLSKSDVKKIVENAANINRPVSLASKSRIGANGTDRDLSDYFAIAEKTVEIIDDFAELVEEDIYQLMLGCYADEYATILENTENAKIATWWPRAADVITANGDKGVAVEKVLEYYGFSRAESMAFGDGANDIEMLQAVGTGVVMDNASDEVKKYADYVCRSVSDDGIYFFCKEKGLI